MFFTTKIITKSPTPTSICSQYVTLITAENLTRDNWDCKTSCVSNNSCFEVDGVEPRILKKLSDKQQTFSILGSSILDTNSSLELHSQVWINGILIAEDDLAYVNSSLLIVSLNEAWMNQWMNSTESTGSLDVMVQINGTGFNRSTEILYFENSYIHPTLPLQINTSIPSSIDLNGQFIDFNKSSPMCIVWKYNKEDQKPIVVASSMAIFISTKLMKCTELTIDAGGIYNIDIIYSAPEYSTTIYPSIDYFFRPELFLQGDKIKPITLNVLSPAPSCSSRFSDSGIR
jgi:hypothetical protein